MVMVEEAKHPNTTTSRSRADPWMQDTQSDGVLPCLKEVGARLLVFLMAD